MRRCALIRSLRNLSRFRALPQEERCLVFYSEGAHHWPHLGPLVHALVDHLDQRVCYISSDPEDPGLALDHASVQPFLIQAATAFTALFRSLEARVLVTSLPDLGSFNFRRSAAAVHYVYVHHSIVSTHMAYRESAFDHFDTIFCVGPHQVTETREAEKLRSLPPKQLFEHGYGRLDAILAENARHTILPRQGHLLVAPSWSNQGLLETNGGDLIEVLARAGYRVTVRPHPETRRRSPSALTSLEHRFNPDPAVRFETDVSSCRSLLEAELMISDWSGAALEFAFGLERPVLFVDLPRKVNNPEYTALSCPPLEVAIRSEIGAMNPSDDYASAPERVRSLLDQRRMLARRIRAARDRWVFNPGFSASLGAQRLTEIADGTPRQNRTASTSH